MQAIGLRLLVTLITFALGLSCARLAGFLARPVHNIKPISVGAVLVPQHPGFHFVERTCESGCIETYETSKSQQVSFVLACYSGSARDAHRDMEALFEHGRVVQRLWYHDRQGDNERIIVSYPQDETGENPTKVFTYHLGDICFEYIEAGSLELALDFEQSGIKDSW
jgi:hypothetical protein